MNKWIIGLLVAVVAVFAWGSVASAAGPNDGWGERAWARGRIETVSDLLDMRPREVVQTLRAGGTVAELAAEQGVALGTIADALAAPRRERLAAGVAGGTLTQAQADYINAECDEYLNNFLTLPFRRALLAEPLADLATVLNVSEDTIVAAIEGEATLADFIEGQGRTVEEVVPEMVALRDAELSERVALDLMTETQKRVALQRYERRLTAGLNGEWPQAGSLR